MPTSLPLDALEMALWTREREGHTDGGRLDGLIHHSDAGSQYVSIRYADRLADAGAIASIGTAGDSYDNAQIESLIGLYKLECVRHEGPWRCVDDLELATLNWVHWSRYAGDPLGGRGGRAGRVTASIGDLSCRSFRVFCALPARAAVS